MAKIAKVMPNAEERIVSNYQRYPSQIIIVQIEDSNQDYVAITEVKKKVKVRCEIRGTTGYRGDVNIVNVDGDIVDGGCNGEVLSDVVGGEN